MTSPLVECVPNFSEGRDKSVIDAIARAISGVSEVRLLDVDAGADTNRTVYTFVGTPDAVSEAAFRGAAEAASLIDMSKHQGAHPRMGALDVCPIVPVSGVTMDQCVEAARALGRRLAEALALPVYFYEYAATRPERRNLADIRAGEYEGLGQKLADPAWAPDAGPAAFNERLGATVVGAREFLIAYNVNVNTRDQKLANEVALNIREAGRLKRDSKNQVITDEQGRELRVPGRLKAVRAIGWYIEQYRQAQVSVNLLSYRTTPLHEVFETTRDEAGKLGLVVTGSELVGMTPLEPLVEAGRYLPAEARPVGRTPGARAGRACHPYARTLAAVAIRPRQASHRVRCPCGRTTGINVDRALRRRSFEQLAGSGRRLGGGAGRQPRRGAGGDGRQSHRRQERLRGGMGIFLDARRARTGAESGVAGRSG